MTVDGQLAAFAEQLMPYSRDAAAACLAAQSGSLSGEPLHTSAWPHLTAPATVVAD